MKFNYKFVFILFIMVFASVAEANAYTYGNRSGYGYYNSRYGYKYGNYAKRATEPGRQKTWSPYIGIDFVSAQFADDENSTAFLNKTNNGASVKLGMKFSNYIGVELFYTKTKQSEVDSGITGILQYDIVGYGADLNITMPVSKSVDLIGIAGAGYYDIEHQAKTGTFKPSIPFSNELAYRFGGGVQYNINEHFGLRASYIKVLFDHENVDDMDELSAGIRFTF